jgi:hypothetical protein
VQGVSPPQTFADQQPAQTFPLTGGMHGNRAKQQRLFGPDTHGPKADRPTNRTIVIAGYESEPLDRRHPITQAIGTQGRAPRRKAQIEKGFDLPPVIWLLFGDIDHWLLM